MSTYKEYIQYLNICNKFDTDFEIGYNLVISYYEQEKVNSWDLSEYNTVLNTLLEKFKIEDKGNPHNLITDANNLCVLQWQHLDDLQHRSSDLSWLLYIPAILSVEVDPELEKHEITEGVSNKFTGAVYNDLEKWINKPTQELWPTVDIFLDSAHKLRQEFPLIYSPDDDTTADDNFDFTAQEFNNRWNFIYKLINMVTDDDFTKIKIIENMNVRDFLQQASYRIDKMKMEAKQHERAMQK